ncbi:hypothetical protein NP233_g8450 [Leucocoprinus birnbaumii]|uniref:Dihydrolipoamide acetyltransferase component of pyruvate dehydrogenase complex n=1 Tax=Leucocoprinus birnbaumii TaxID=56174 RepID=A0AAD5VSS7_9AGAR|nr:hypothetical protein NP233_g8450 [Leucocoprinus birnbaumii]
MWGLFLLSYPFLFSAALAGAIPTTTVTLWGVEKPLETAVPRFTASPSYSATPFGVGPNGETTYLVAAAATEVVLVESKTTKTIPVTTTATYIIVEDSNGLTEIDRSDIGHQPASAIASCKFDGTTGANCVAVGLVATSTAGVTTYTSVPTPLYTIVEYSGASALRLYAHRGFHSSWTNYAKKLEKFKLADIGEGITECEIIKWTVKPSATITAFDPLCEVQSDKASVEITSPFDGVLKEILVKEGDVAKVGEGLCLIEVEEDAIVDTDEAGDKPVESSATSTHAPATSEQTPPSPPESESRPQKRLHPLDPNYVPTPSSKPLSAPTNEFRTRHCTGRSQDILAMPSVRHYARSKGVDLALLAPGSGRDGRIERADVDAYLARSGPYAASETSVTPTISQQDVVVELNRTRHNMWKAMEKSLEIPHFGYSTTLDVTNLQNVLSSLNSRIPSRYLPPSARKSEYIAVNPSALYPAPNQDAVPDSHQFTKLTFLPLLLKSLSLAMMEWPLFRSSITPDIQEKAKPTVTIRPVADIALALSTPTGLYTPTLTGINANSVYDIQSKLKNLQQLGRQIPCGLTPKEMPRRGGTITVSNVGSIGKGVFASPVLVPGGGVAICAIGRAEWVMDVSKEHWDEDSGIGQRRLKLPISWSADHRVVEGAELAAFVECWRAYVENPSRIIGVMV